MPLNSIFEEDEKQDPFFDTLLPKSTEQQKEEEDPFFKTLRLEEQKQPAVVEQVDPTRDIDTEDDDEFFKNLNEKRMVPDSSKQPLPVIEKQNIESPDDPNEDDIKKWINEGMIPDFIRGVSKDLKNVLPVIGLRAAESFMDSFPGKAGKGLAETEGFIYSDDPQQGILNAYNAWEEKQNLKKIGLKKLEPKSPFAEMAEKHEKKMNPWAAALSGAYGGLLGELPAIMATMGAVKSFQTMSNVGKWMKLGKTFREATVLAEKTVASLGQFNQAMGLAVHGALSGLSSGDIEKAAKQGITGGMMGSIGYLTKVIRPKYMQLLAEGLGFGTVHEVSSAIERGELRDIGEMLKDPDLLASIGLGVILKAKGLRGETIEAESKVNKLAEKFDVEYKWKKANAPEVGFRLKNMNSVRAMFEQMGLLASKSLMKDYRKRKSEYGKEIKKKVITGKEIEKFGASRESESKDMLNIVLSAEDIQHYESLSQETRKIIGPAVKQLSGLMEAAKEQYKKRGVDIDFKKRITEEIENLISTAESPSDVADLKVALAEARRIDFVHIPSSYWLENFIKRDPAGGARVLRLMALQERKVLSIKSMIDSGILDPNVVHPVDILGSYYRRIGSDWSMLDLIDAAKKDGMAFRKTKRKAKQGVTEEKGSIKEISSGKRLGDSEFVGYGEDLGNVRSLGAKRQFDTGKQIGPGEPPIFGGKERTGSKPEGPRYPKGFVDAPPNAPILKDYKIHPMLAEQIAEMTRYHEKGSSKFDKIMSLSKMAQFYNPLILPMYDVVQAGMAGALTSWRTPKNIATAIRDAVKKTPNYWEALENGLASQPYSNPASSYKQTLDKIKLSSIGKLINKDNLNVVKQAYNLSWNMAWSMDRTVRMITYNHLRSQGKTPREAGQLAAMFHGDYASVPPATRRALNKVFFTPTFKIVMGKLYLNMMKSAVEYTGKLGKVNQTTKTFAKGAALTLGISMGVNMIMNRMGFETDEFGRRYIKQIETDEGDKEMVIVWSAPSNMFMKYWSRFKSAFINPVESKPFDSFIKRNKWEFHPFYRVTQEIVANDDGLGNKVYEITDTNSTKALKSVKYAFDHTLRIFSAFEMNEKEQSVRDKFAKDHGKLIGLLTDAVTFKYTRSTKDRRIMYQINKLKDEMKDMIRDGKMDAEVLGKFKDKINQLLMELDYTLESNRD
ncbi:MAG TPA: hypothetical protein VMY43_12720 [Methanothrix sp.]|nr:hypothetical protein [Methanothrix sp.]